MDDLALIRAWDHQLAENATEEPLRRHYRLLVIQLLSGIPGPLDTVTLADVEAFLDSIAPKSKMRNRALVGFRSFFEWATEAGHVAASPIPARPAVPRITGVRDTDILALLALGFSYREIADTLGLRRGSMNWHLGRLYRRLGARNRNRGRGYRSPKGGATYRRTRPVIGKPRSDSRRSHVLPQRAPVWDRPAFRLTRLPRA